MTAVRPCSFTSHLSLTRAWRRLGYVERVSQRSDNPEAFDVLVL
jgi:hypothetical protein